jgi:hypothetical protein
MIETETKKTESRAIIGAMVSFICWFRCVYFPVASAFPCGQARRGEATHLMAAAGGVPPRGFIPNRRAALALRTSSSVVRRTGIVPSGDDSLERVHACSRSCSSSSASPRPWTLTAVILCLSTASLCQNVLHIFSRSLLQTCSYLWRPRSFWFSRTQAAGASARRTLQKSNHRITRATDKNSHETCQYKKKLQQCEMVSTEHVDE